MSSTRGGLAETWAMARAKRARKAETLKQPNLHLRSGAPYFYPDPSLYTERARNILLDSATILLP